VSVTLWTDWAVPTATFDVYLTGFDVQTFNVRDLLAAGALPSTGAGVSPIGQLSAGAEAFPGCAGSLRQTLPPDLANRHLGRSIGGSCFASPRTGMLATGYITVDVINRCSTLDPSSPGYFAADGSGVAADDNALLGEYSYVDSARRMAQGEQAVHIVADAEAYGSGYTFYGRYVNGDGRDHRQPLGSRFAASYAHDARQGLATRLTVWRDTKSAAASPVACGTQPTWAPLLAPASVAWNEEEGVTTLPASTSRFPWATQSVSVGSDQLPIADPFGWTLLDLGHRAELFGLVSQGWVTVLKASARGLGTAQDAYVVQTVCEVP
jgi:hypothetical protein